MSTAIQASTEIDLEDAAVARKESKDSGSEQSSIPVDQDFQAAVDCFSVAADSSGRSMSLPL
jgi:hypothetical protein